MLRVGVEDSGRGPWACWAAGGRVAAMARGGGDVQVMGAPPLLFFYHRPGAQALECARLFNDAGREICERAPRRLKSLCQGPLQDTDLACRELTRAMADGHVGEDIGNHLGTRDPNDEGLNTFLQPCAGEGAAA